MIHRPVLVSLSLLALAGCVSPNQFESDPVEVQTSRGIVTCQLYTREIVQWDRAIDRPEAMSVQAGDAYCLAEGRRLRDDT